MKKAFNQAIRALNADEVPVGAVICRNGEIVSRAYNMRESKKLATAHAEILAIEKACKKLGDWRLDDCEMYVTLEPCVMCAGAILNARIKKVYYGACEPKGGAIESAFRILDGGGLNWTTEYEGGVMKERCSGIIKEFFKNRRA